MSRFQGGAAAMPPGTVASASPLGRTKPPNGMAFRVMSVPLMVPSLAILGGNPKPNSSTWIPNAFEARACPASWITTRIPSTMMNWTITQTVVIEYSSKYYTYFYGAII